MSEESKTLWELNPDTFTVPGQSQNGAEPPPDLVFVRDDHVRGLYRATINPKTFFTSAREIDREIENEIKIHQHEK